MASTLKTSLGEFRGKAGDGVVQYLGIKYASLKDRLSVPEMVTSYESGIIDASEYGPRVIAAEACQSSQSLLVQQTLPISPAPPMSGVDCLNLNITIPDIKSDRLLPVMVFIHGGGYIMGGNWWPQYDPSRLIRLSVDQGKPIIVVNINYRLAVMGNMTSKELRDAGYPGNNSTRDQKCALLWIKEHIASFGGDPDNVTAFGDSAGAASVITQLFSPEPLFKRAISMCGSPLMGKPLLSRVAEVTYDTMMKNLKLEEASTKECIKRLLTIDPDTLIAATPMLLPLLPLVDGVIVPAKTSFRELGHGDKSVPGRKWCSELMIGDAQHDGYIVAYMGLLQRKEGIAAAFCASTKDNLSKESSAEAVLQAYGITPSMPDDTAFKAVLDYATDILYYAPAVAYARFWPGKAYYYQFNEPNPWDGLFKGCATHTLDAIFLFQNYNEKLTPEAQRVAAALAKNVIDFVNGVAPWKEVNGEKGFVKTFGPSNVATSANVEDNGWGNGRRNTLFKLQSEGKIDLDELSLAWDKFMAGQ